MDGPNEAVCEGFLVLYFEGCALGGKACGVWMVSLHKFNEFLCEIGCGGVLCRLGEEPLLSFGG